MTTMIKNFFQCCGNKIEKKEETFNSVQSNLKSDSQNEEKNDKIKTCNTNSKNTNNKEESNQKRYSFISNITYKSKEKSDINYKENNKKENNSFIFNIDSSFKENKHFINSKIHQFTTLSFTHIEENNNNSNFKRRISLTEMNGNLNNKNPFFFDSNIIEKNYHFENSKKSFISSFSSSDKKSKKELKGIIIDNKNHINYFDNLKNIKKIKPMKVNVNSDIIIVDEEIELAPKLILTDMKNGNLFNGRVIKIDASGYAESLRGKRDGKTYFGIKNELSEKSNNDININLNSNIINIEQLFVIFYDRKKTRYYIQYLNKDFNKNKLFMTVRIFNELFINKEEMRLLYLILGKILITISIGEEDDLCLKLYNNTSSNPENRRILEYNYKIKDSPITIGREKCSIIIDNNYISRVHTTLIYSNNNKWCLIDGNEKRKHSTHGTWIILSNNLFELNPMNDNYEVKIGEQIFNISIQTE